MPASPSPVHAIEFRALTAGYSATSRVIDDLTAAVPGPGLVALTGPNGAGKSTLVELCTGYLRPVSGAVLLDGLPAQSPLVRGVRRACRSQVALLPEMSARDHLVLAARSHGASIQEVLARGTRYGLDPWFHTRAKDLSNGNRRKLWLVMSTVGTFRYVLLDEPFQGMDDHGTSVLTGELSAWRATALVLLIAHDWPPALVPDIELVMGTQHGHTLSAADPVEVRAI